MAGQDFQAISGTLQFQQDETVKNLTIPLLHDRAAVGTKSFRITLSNPTGGATLGTASTTLNIVGADVTVAPPFETALTIQRSGMFSTLTWAGGGLLQKADRPTGPWQTLPVTTGEYTVQSPVPATFYRVVRPRPVNVYVPSNYNGQVQMPLVILLHGYNGTGADEESYMRIQPLAETRGFLYCSPDGTLDRWGSRFWNGTDASADFGYTGVDDAGYLRSLIEEIGSQFTLDRKRIYLIGVASASMRGA